jgi:hypothetical protein
MKTNIKIAVATLCLSAGLFFAFGFKPAESKVVYTQITTIESVVPGGLGRSRMITTDPNGEYKEVDMENFFSLVGINFGNVRKNDKTITDKLNQMTSDGWALDQVNSGVYSADKSTGIFVTRYLFKKTL